VYKAKLYSGIDVPYDFLDEQINYLPNRTFRIFQLKISLISHNFSFVTSPIYLVTFLHVSETNKE